MLCITRDQVSQKLPYIQSFFFFFSLGERGEWGWIFQQQQGFWLEKWKILLGFGWLIVKKYIVPYKKKITVTFHLSSSLAASAFLRWSLAIAKLHISLLSGSISCSAEAISDENWNRTGASLSLYHHIFFWAQYTSTEHLLFWGIMSNSSVHTPLFSFSLSMPATETPYLQKVMKDQAMQSWACLLPSLEGTLRAQFSCPDITVLFYFRCAPLSCKFLWGWRKSRRPTIFWRGSWRVNGVP